jgi:hypothetical protein
MPCANFLWMQDAGDRVFADDRRGLSFGVRSHSAFIDERSSRQYHPFQPCRLDRRRTSGVAWARALDPDDQNSEEVCFILAAEELVASGQWLVARLVAGGQ